MLDVEVPELPEAPSEPLKEKKSKSCIVVFLYFFIHSFYDCEGKCIISLCLFQPYQKKLVKQ